MTNTLI